MDATNLIPTSLTASPFAGADFTLCGLTLRESMPKGLVHRPAGMHEYYFVYCYGEMTVILAGVVTRCAAGSMVIWEPGDVQEYGCADESWVQTYLDCSGPFIQQAIADLALPLRVPFVCPHASRIEQYLEALAHEITDRTAPDMVIARELLDIWLREVHHIAHADPQQGRDMPARMVAARVYLEAHYAEAISMEALADHVHLSVTHLRREFKRYFRVPPIQYLLDLRMRRAGDLLHDPQLSVAEVAARVGYQEPNYFSLVFKKHHGVNPLAWRRHACGEHAVRRREEERRLREFHYWLREGWHPVYAADFTQVSTLDSRLQVYWHDNLPFGQAVLHPARELLALTHDALQLKPIMPGWVSMQWEEDISEEARWELTIDLSQHIALNVCLAISGNLQTGYRLRLYGEGHLALETVQDGTHRILVQQENAIPESSECRVSFWRSGNVFSAEINARRVLTYHDPLPPSGPRNRTCAIGHFCATETIVIRRLQLLTRQAPRFVDILEPGRIMLRQGYTTAAASWFANLLRTQEDADVLREAQYLAACATLSDDHAGKEAALAVVANDEDNPFRVHALRDIGLLRLRQPNLAGAVEAACTIAQLAPHDPTPQQIADHLVALLREAAPAARDAILAYVRQLPVTRLHLWGAQLTSLEALRGMPLTELDLRTNSLTDLSPLAQMPLYALDIGVNAITDLGPLRGLPLRDLQCFYNQITDLSPLQGMALKSLSCYSNAIHDLSPLGGMPLENLHCYHNQISTLAPLAGSPLRYLNCVRNRISDLTPLRESPVTSLSISGNPVTDLRPLRGLPLTTLEIAETPLDARNRRVIAELPLERFMHGSCAPEAWTMLDDLPRLQYLNHHTVAHARELASTLARTVAVWQRGTAIAPPLQPATALRQFAYEADGVAYLAVPLWLTRAEAEAFCAWQGGRLPQPITPEGVQALHDYLLTVNEAGYSATYHLGLHDTMFSLPYWDDTTDINIARRTGAAYLSVSQETNSLHWRGEVRDTPTYVLIEWRYADD